MSYEEKLTHTEKVICAAIAAARNPIVWSSFGHRSLVLLEIFHALGFSIPIMWMRPGIGPDKNIRKLIKKYDLEVIDYYPSGIARCGDASVLVRYYDTGGGYIPLLFSSPLEETSTGDEPTCDEHAYAWDISFFGAGENYFTACGANALPADGTKVGSTLLCFPLRSWDREDINRYIEENEVDVNG